MNAVRQTSYSEAVEKHFLGRSYYLSIFLTYPLTAVEVASVFTRHRQFFARSISGRPGITKDAFSFEISTLFRKIPDSLRRLKGNALAEKKMKTAKKFSYLVSLFPFVRAVCFRALSPKVIVDERSDIDYFIVTETNRL